MKRNIPMKGIGKTDGEDGFQMELRQLFTFIAVVETGSFTRAATQLSYAQSSVTAQIQALESELETPLFNRLGNKTVLTDAGQRFLPYAQEITRMHTMAKDAIRFQSEFSGTITIGAPESLAAFRLPDIIRDYKRLYPDVSIILKPGLCWEMGDRIRSGELDLAFRMTLESEERDLYTKTLIRERMALIAAPDHRLASKGNFEPVDLKDEVILCTEPGCLYRIMFEQALAKHGIFPNPGLEFWSLEAIKNCVMSGLGISFLPLVAVRKELREGKLAQLDWDDEPQRFDTQIAYHKNKALTPPLREFLVLTERHAARWVETEAKVGVELEEGRI